MTALAVSSGAWIALAVLLVVAVAAGAVAAVAADRKQGLR